MWDGFRESELSWRELLEDLRRRALELPPQLTVGDGALGFWAALNKVYPGSGEQRCWLHKMANVLDKLPRSMHSKGKRAVQDIYLAPSRRKRTRRSTVLKTCTRRNFPTRWNV